MYPELQWYRITKTLSEDGGMCGGVYLADDFRGKRKAAIKHVIPKSNKHAQMFRQEANHYIALRHPNLMQVYNFADETRNGKGYFLAMEFIEGWSLLDILKKTGLMPEERLIPMFLQVLDTIGYLHSQEILHLDIKPANIMVQPNGNVKIIDMGISIDVKNQVGELRNHAGTPAYMAPEQICREQIGYYTDIWQIGITLFKALTGTEPFVSVTSREELNYRIVNYKLPKASDFYPEISDEIQRILEKALAKSPHDRYSSCDEFARDLKNYQLKRCYQDTYNYTNYF